MNRLASYTDGTDTINYTYDGDSNRLTQTVTGQNPENYSYFNVPLGGLSKVLVELNSGENYIYGGRPLYRSSTTNTIFYHNDGLGSTLKGTDISGNILKSYKYDAFGDLRASNETVDNDILFAGEFQDANGLIYLRARYYDPNDGRFLTQDSYLGDAKDPITQNRYAYGNNNPVIYIDPTGHVAVCAGNQGTSGNTFTIASTSVAYPLTSESLLDDIISGAKNVAGKAAEVATKIGTKVVGGVTLGGGVLLDLLLNPTPTASDDMIYDYPGNDPTVAPEKIGNGEAGVNLVLVKVAGITQKLVKNCILI